jgi:hypothetical protein
MSAGVANSIESSFGIEEGDFWPSTSKTAVWPGVRSFVSAILTSFAIAGALIFGEGLRPNGDPRNHGRSSQWLGR